MEPEIVIPIWISHITTARSLSIPEILKKLINPIRHIRHGSRGMHAITMKQKKISESSLRSQTQAKARENDSDNSVHLLFPPKQSQRLLGTYDDG